MMCQKEMSTEERCIRKSARFMVRVILKVNYMIKNISNCKIIFYLVYYYNFFKLFLFFIYFIILKVVKLFYNFNGLNDYIICFHLFCSTCYNILKKCLVRVFLDSSIKQVDKDLHNRWQTACTTDDSKWSMPWPLPLPDTGIY